MGLFSKASGSGLPSFLLSRSQRQQPNYGSLDGPPSPSLVPKLSQPAPRPASRSGSPLLSINAAISSPRRDRIRAYDLEDLLEVEVEDDEVLEEGEELVNVPYSTLVRNYTLVPICSFLFLGALIALFTIAWPQRDSPQPPHLHPRFPSLLVGASAWIISYTLRLPILSLATGFSYFTNAFTLTLSTVLSIALEEALRLGALVLLGLRLNAPPGEDWEDEWPRTGEEAFQKTLWVAIGWAIVEVCWSVAQGYEQLALYRDILPPSPSFLQQYWPGPAMEEAPTTPTSESESISHHFVHAALKKSASPPHAGYRQASRPRSAIEAGLHGEAALDAEMRELINLQTRVELEMVYGVPPPNIPVFLSVLQRIDSILLTIGLTLTISSVYLTQLAATSDPPPSSPASMNACDVHTALWFTLPTYLVLTLLHASLAVMWKEALPKLGMHVASYTALVVSLGVFFAGLGWWGALS